MTDLDLERLGNVWRQRPSARELEELQRSAEAVRRRARWMQVVDIIAAVVVAGVVLAMILANPETDTLVVGGGAILVLLVSQMRSRRFRQSELRSLNGSAEQMLDQSIQRVGATCKRALSMLVVMPPGFLLGLLVASVAERHSGGELARRVAAQPGLRTAIIVVGCLVVAATFVQVIRTWRRSKRELERLIALRDSYREEQGSAAP